MAIKLPTIGECRQVGTLYLNHPSPLGAGKRGQFYYMGDPSGNLQIVRGRLRDKSGSRSLEFGSLVISGTHEWICRFATALSISIGKDAKWIIDNRTFIISSYELIDNKLFWYRFSLNEDK